MKLIGFFIILSILSLIFNSCNESDPMPPVNSYDISRIYSINLDGSELKLITEGNDFSLLSNDKIMYIKNNRIHSCNLDGSDTVTISPPGYEIYGYQLFLNNTKIQFFQYAFKGVSVYEMNSDGSGLTQLDIPNNLRIGNELKFSPDGSKIAFESNSGLYLMSSDGSDLTQIKDTTNRSDCYDISFTTNGKSVVYIYDIQHGVALDLRLYNIKTTLDTSLFYNDDGNTVIAYAVSKWNTLLFSNGDGINLENLSDFTHSFLYRGGEPYFSYDSTKVTFMDFDINAICVFDLTDNSPHFIQVDLPKNYISHPVLSSDEKRVYFQADTSWEVPAKIKTDDYIVN